MSGRSSNVFCFVPSRRRHTRYIGDWSSDVCSSDLNCCKWLQINRPFFQAVTDLSEGGKWIDWGHRGGRGMGEHGVRDSSFSLHPSSQRCPAAERNDPADQVDCGAGTDRHGQRGQVRAPSSGSEPRPTQNRKRPRTMRPARILIYGPLSMLNPSKRAATMKTTDRKSVV